MCFKEDLMFTLAVTSIESPPRLPVNGMTDSVKYGRVSRHFLASTCPPRQLGICDIIKLPNSA